MRAWQRMLSGRRLDILNPSPLDVEIEDITHGLARVARWNGQTIGKHAFSVAQHSLLVLDLALKLKSNLKRDWQLAALLHDASEYVIGDLISPFKQALSADYRNIENNLLAAIHTRFSLPINLPKNIEQLIKKADKISAYLEAIQLAGFEVEEAEKFFTKPPAALENVKFDLTPLPTQIAQDQFLNTFAELAENR